jgi:mannan endo-1,4-beta-mannosidase
MYQKFSYIFVALTLAFASCNEPSLVVCPLDNDSIPLQDTLPHLVVQNASKEAQNVFKFLQENYGSKIISATSANVDWNINEAEWVYKHTNIYPAMNCFDYIHLYGNWINYTNTTVVENWWNNKGLVGAIWHWNVPTAQGANSYAFYTSDTSFDISQAIIDGTYENGIIKADFQKVADRLLLLKNKNIPVIWRPLHEASGGWFWWGAKGATPFKELWKMMFDYFQERGLNNLIWVWTSEINDQSWYPGEQYVDIIGRDAYNKTAATTNYNEYNTLKSRYPDKMITLSECGNVTEISAQLNAGATWSWFMPWYDYERTNVPSSAAFNQTTHQYANIDFWLDAFADERVLSRDEMPNLK